MQQITLSQVLPEVFRERTDLVSEVWRQELSLERGKHYLIEASSGAGKSSFCSFVYGWRGDYSGRIAFDGQDIRALSASAWGRIRRRIPELPLSGYAPLRRANGLGQRVDQEPTHRA